ncbi:Mobile element protein [Bacillus cereus]|nr:Mobile element protein [Bacillus cereus]
MNVKYKRRMPQIPLIWKNISILLCSSTMFQMRQLLFEKKKQELIEYKAMYIIKDYFSLFY